MFREAAWLGHQVIVGLNSDDWLLVKKVNHLWKFYEKEKKYLKVLNISVQ